MKKSVEKIFYDFLSSQGITIEFSLALKKKKSMGYQSIDQYLMNVIGIGIDPSSLIQKAFCWDITKEGKYFWKRHSTNWKKYYSNAFQNKEVDLSKVGKPW